MCVNINKAINVALGCVVFRKHHPFPFAYCVWLVKFQGNTCAGAILTKTDRPTTNQQKDKERFHKLKLPLNVAPFVNTSNKEAPVPRGFN